jgi:2-haloacid dehalogenase
VPATEEPRPEVVVFDLGGVLVDWHPDHLYRVLIPDDDDRAAFYRDVLTSEWNRELDLGRPFAEGVRELAERHPDHAMLIRAYHERWLEMMPGELADSLLVVEELAAADVPLYALTNWSAETWHHAEERFAWLDLFDGIVVSGREGVGKPDEAAFRLLLDRYGLEAVRCVFVDDSAANVEAARRYGLHGVRFVDALSLRDELCAVGVLPSRPGSLPP